MGRKRKGRISTGAISQKRVVGALDGTGAAIEPVPERPTSERLSHAQGYYVQSGRGRSQRRYAMMDDNLGRLALRKVLSQQQFVALQRYAYHWFVAGLAGNLSTFDLDRVRVLGSISLGGLAKSESAFYHKRIFYDARLAIGEEPAQVADMIACEDYPITAVGSALGYASPSRGRQKAVEMLTAAGDRLDDFWQAQDKARRK